MIKVHNTKIDTIKNNSVVYISNSQADEMMFVCEENKGVWTLYSKEYGNYSPAFDSLDELKELLQEDWMNGEIIDIDIFEIDGSEIDS